MSKLPLVVEALIDELALSEEDGGRLARGDEAAWLAVAKRAARRVRASARPVEVFIYDGDEGARGNVLACAPCAKEHLIAPERLLDTADGVLCDYCSQGG